jgi:hypothetical protein
MIQVLITIALSNDKRFVMWLNRHRDRFIHRTDWPVS